MNELILFVSSFVTVFCLGFQSRNNIGNHYGAAFITSLVIGASNLFVIKFGAKASTYGEYFAYILGGAFGMVFAMKLHPMIVKRKNEQKQ